MQGGDLIIDDLVIRGLGPVRLTVPAGTCVGVSGPSGIGKSSLLRAVADMEPHDGRVCLGATDRDALCASEWRRMVGLLPSESAWWADGVAQHFLTPEAVCPEALGLREEVLTWPVKRLSSGERQRLSLLRLLDRRPRALLLDEPTANLDGESTRRVESLILDYAQTHRAPVIWVGHSVDQLNRVAQRVVSFDADGVLREAGGEVCR
ncbi:ABC transporter ATP-binding protein [Desulfoluna butyratoxydans]|uniref:Abc transporter-like n=1 Tax=Desulfoluna butyratoxydans TaxID=231438 RepID=A0A4U8YJG7_9BACT|nr:ATP-binding cassette domain-containing protein [Desulfoluna butyratoxydans]VFQ43537.1 abc transporter-like [Desulfoluna butyratoxydans]